MAINLETGSSISKSTENEQPDLPILTQPRVSISEATDQAIAQSLEGTDIKPGDYLDNLVDPNPLSPANQKYVARYALGADSWQFEDYGELLTEDD